MSSYVGPPFLKCPTVSRVPPPPRGAIGRWLLRSHTCVSLYVGGVEHEAGGGGRWKSEGTSPPHSVWVFEAARSHSVVSASRARSAPAPGITVGCGQVCGPHSSCGTAAHFVAQGSRRACCRAPPAQLVRPLRADNVCFPCSHGIAFDDQQWEERAPEVLRETLGQVPLGVGMIPGSETPECRSPSRGRPRVGTVALYRSEPSVHPGRCAVGPCGGVAPAGDCRAPTQRPPASACAGGTHPWRSPLVGRSGQLRRAAPPPPPSTRHQRSATRRPTAPCPCAGGVRPLPVQPVGDGAREAANGPSPCACAPQSLCCPLRGGMAVGGRRPRRAAPSACRTCVAPGCGNPWLAAPVRWWPPH